MVYEELRLLAASRLAQEVPGQTLDATGLVHEAYLHLADDMDRKWNDSHHFFCAVSWSITRGASNARNRSLATPTAKAPCVACAPGIAPALVELVSPLAT
jgi:hypothetical protein